MQCPKCNWKNDEQAHYCSNCAHQLITPPPFYKRHKVLTVLGSLFIVLCLLFIYGIISFVSDVSNEIESQTAEESIVSGSPDVTNTIALINIDGEIVESDASEGFTSLSSDTVSARHIKKVLKDIADDDSVKGILLRINSPGGSAAASDEILTDIKAFKQAHSMPVVTYMTDLAASGGYYVSLSSDKIVANPSAITGSIGVILEYMNYGELASKYGVKSVVIKSGAHKDIVSPFRDPTKDETDILQSVVDDAYDVFLTNVSTNRKMDKEKAKKLADGRIYSAKQAKENGLIDETGSFEDAISLTKKLGQIDEAKVVEFGTEGFLTSLLGSITHKFNLIELPHFNHGSKLMYLYNPTL
jgi:protease-4